jgi:hypothetical protein
MKMLILKRGVKLKNKRAQLGDQVMIIPFLFLLIVIGIGITAGVYLFYGAEYDFRQVQADILNFRVKNCVLDKEIDFSSETDFFEKCGIFFGVQKKEVLIEISSDGERIFGWGDETACLLSGKNDEYPKCKITEFEKNEKTFKVLTGSNQFSRRTNE